MSIAEALKAKMNVNDISDQKRLKEMYFERKMDALFDIDKENREDRVGMHGSGIVADDERFCYREQVLSFYYKNSGDDKIVPNNLKRIFLEGWSVHEKWQMLFRKNGIDRGIEQRGFSEQYQLQFTPDAIVELDGKMYVCEIKSVNTHKFQHMTEHPTAEKQLQLYMHFTAIPHGFVLCEDKNTQAIKCYYYDYDYHKVIPYLERMEKVKQLCAYFEKTGGLPSRKCENEGCKCAQDCNYAQACFRQRIPLDANQYGKMLKVKE